MQSNNVTVATVPSPQRPFFQNKFSAGGFQKTPGFFQNNQQFRQQANAAQAIEFDGKRLRKAVARKTVDYNASIVKYLETRTWQRDYRDRRALQPDVGYSSELMPPMSYLDNPVNAITTKFVRTSTNKMRCPIFCVVWTPEGRRLITGASSGEFTLWNGLTFNFETILQAHDSPVRCMVWSHNDIWMVTGDHSGYVKYWQSNMNNVKMFQAHKEPLRGLSFCPTDTKFVTCSDDGTVRIWDFLRCHEERILRGHGADVKCVSWHPQKSLIVSGSKDSQQPIKLWDPKSGQSLATLHAHKSTVMEVKWNQNGTWMLTASRDHLLKLFDIRNMSQEVQTFRGHKKEACSISWHPIHESMFVSGGSDGSVMFWVVGADKEVGSMEQAHESCVWSLGWHPLGHILCTGSNDHTSKFWTRNRPGDRMRDKYNLNTLPRGQDETAEYDEPSSGAIPGMGLDLFGDGENDDPDYTPAIPGLDFGTEDAIKNGNSTVHVNTTSFQHSRKVPFSKPIPRQFQQQWMENKQPLLLAPPPNAPNDINQTQQQQSQGLNQPSLQNSSTMGSMLPSGALLPQSGPPPPLQMGNVATNLPGGPMLPGNMLPSGGLLPQGGPPPPLPMGNMAPNLPGGPLLPNIQNMSGTIMPTMQNNPDNQMIMGDMSNRQNLLPTRPMGDFQGGTQPTGGNNPNFVMNQQGTPMLQPNMQMTGNQFVPAPNMFMPPRPQLDQQQNNETFGPRANQIMMQRQGSLASRPNESDNVSSMDNRPNVNVSVSSPISNIGDNRNSQMSSGTGNKPPEDRVSDWRNKVSAQLDTDSRNVSTDNSNNMTGNIGPNIPPFNYMPQQNQQQFHQQPQMMQNEQRFGVNEFDDRLSSQSNFNRNNMPGRGGGIMPNQMHQQNSNFQPHNQFSGNFQDHDNMRYMGNSDYGDMSDNNMRKRQWDEGPGDMGGGIPEMGGNMPQMGGNIPQMGGNIPQMGGNIPQMGGNIPQMGGNIPQMGGNIPQMGGNIPQMGGNIPQMGGNISQMGGNIPQMGGNIPQMGGNIPQMGGNIPQMGGNNPQMGGNIPHQQQMGAPHQQMGGNGFFNQSQGGFQNRSMGNMNNMNNRGPPPSSRGGYMRGGGGGGGGRGMMGPQRGGHTNRPFRGNFRGNRGNMRGNSNF